MADYLRRSRGPSGFLLPLVKPIKTDHLGKPRYTAEHDAAIRRDVAHMESIHAQAIWRTGISAVTLATDPDLLLDLVRYVSRQSDGEAVALMARVNANGRDVSLFWPHTPGAATAVHGEPLTGMEAH